MKIFELYERAWKVRQISLNCELSSSLRLSHSGLQGKTTSGSEELRFKKIVIAIKLIH